MKATNTIKVAATLSSTVSPSPVPRITASMVLS